MNQGLQDLVHAGGYGNDDSGGIGGGGGDYGVATVALVALAIVAMEIGVLLARRAMGELVELVT